MSRLHAVSVLDRIVERVPIRTGLQIRSTHPLLNPLGIVRQSWAHRQLILQFAKQDVLTRYQGSYMGMVTVVALVTAVVGYTWFELTRGGYADVL